jgi:two-component system nitrate/nitrite response regulator NarL
VGVTVLVVDDHAEFRTAARRLFEAGGFEVIGEAADIASAMAAARELRPRVVVLDVQLPDGDGIDSVGGLLEDDADRSVVLVSTRDESAYGTRIRESAARGFIQKIDLSANRLIELLGG